MALRKSPFFKFLLTSLLVIGGVVLLTMDYSVSCVALETLTDRLIFQPQFEAMLLYGGMAIVWLLGLIFFVFIPRLKTFNVYYVAVIITLVSLSPLIYLGINRYPDPDHFLKEQICGKSTDDGSTLIIEGLTNEEYHYLCSKAHWLPTTSAQASQVNIRFQRDNSPGQDKLRIQYFPKEGEYIDTALYQEWICENGVYLYPN